MPTYSHVEIFESVAHRMLQSEAAQRLVESIAAKGAELAADNTPVVTGQHRDDITHGSLPVEDGMAMAYFGSKSHTWHLIEFGSAKNPAHRPLTRAAESLGVRWEPEPK